MVTALVVHTTGINLQGLLANVASIVIILGAFTTLLVRNFKRSVTEDIRAVIRDDVTPKLDEITKELKKHDTRIARLEGVEEGKRQAIAQASVGPS